MIALLTEPNLSKSGTKLCDGQKRHLSKALADLRKDTTGYLYPTHTLFGTSLYQAYPACMLRGRGTMLGHPLAEARAAARNSEDKILFERNLRTQLTI